MASDHGPERPSLSPTRPGPHEDVTSAAGRGTESDSERQQGADAQQQDSGTPRQQSPKRPKSPAYVAPIPKIGSITPISPGIQVSPSERPNLPPFIGDMLLEGVVDDDGDIVHEKTGQVLARAAGDLPSIVGRRVSNRNGDILGDNGELLGYVADLELGSAQPVPSGPPRSLFDLMGRARSSLMVDQHNNILDSTGAVVGTFYDNNNPLHRKEKEEREAREREREAASAAQKTETSQDRQQQQRSPPPGQPSPPPPQQEQSQSQPTGDGQPRPRRTEEERRENAEAWRKENPNESPSDIFLDVKSTREGIQLTIRIPTVFNGQQTTPHISFS